MPREATLARTLVELADTLVADFDVVELLTILADRCVEVLEVDAAGLMLVAPDGDLRVMASSSEAMRVLELFELQSEEGPCLDCYRTGQPVVNQDLAKVNGRWPRFAAEALAAASSRCTHCRCDCEEPSSVRSTCFTSCRGRCNRLTSKPPKRSPTSPPSASFSTEPRSTQQGQRHQRTAQQRAQQPHRHRTSQGNGR
jgi:hypothetical protein